MDTSYPKLTPGGKRLLIVIGVVAVLIPVLLTYVLLNPPNLPTTISTAQSTSSSSSASSSASSTIIIPAGIGNDKSLNFQPSNITVAAGTTITWVDKDTSIHDIDFTSMPAGASLATNPSPNTTKWTGDMYSVTLTVPGTYTYVCDYHDWMTGTITVTG